MSVQQADGLRVQRKYDELSALLSAYEAKPRGGERVKKHMQLLKAEMELEGAIPGTKADPEGALSLLSSLSSMVRPQPPIHYPTHTTPPPPPPTLTHT